MAIGAFTVPKAFAAIPGGSLDPNKVPKYQQPLIIPPEMPRSTTDPPVNYQIAVRQFQQQILPPGLPEDDGLELRVDRSPGHRLRGRHFHYPAFTIEAQSERRSR